MQQGKQKDDETKSRPIKVIVKTVNEKNSIMGKLSELKTAPDRFKKVSVTDDYTVEERQTNKLSEARNKTETEGNGPYVLKGPWNSKKRIISETVKKDPGRNPINNYLVSRQP